MQKGVRAVFSAPRGLCTASALPFGWRMTPKPPSSVQRLLDFARQLGAKGGAPLASQDAEDLQRLLAEVPLEELGFTQKALEDPQSALGKGTSGPVSYSHIYEDPAVSLGIFLLAAHAEIPLHNHPGMHVASRLLFGDLHVRAYDLQHRGAPEGGGAAASLVTNRVLRAPCQPLMLFPNAGGNIHSFYAVTPCAVLDVLTPPYDTNGGRPCTYYVDPLPQDAAEGSEVLLQEKTSPDEFVVTRRAYRGVRVV